MSVVLKRTVVGDTRFDNLSESNLRQSQVNSVCQSSGPSVLIGQFRHDGIGSKTGINFVISHWPISNRLLLVDTSL